MTQEVTTEDDAEKTQILAKKFFPNSGVANLTNITSETPPKHTLNLQSVITKKTLNRIIRNLSNSKISDPDGISNEAIKQLRESLLSGLVTVISTYFAAETLSLRYRESTIIALRKKSKKNYTISDSYRLITLKNTLAKLIKKVLAEIITDAAEENDLLL